LASSQSPNVSCEISYDGLQHDICEKADRLCHSFMAREHNCPEPRVNRNYLDGGRRMLSYRTCGIISSSSSRHSGRRAEPASTKQLSVTPRTEFHEWDAGRTEQTEEVPSRGTILQLLPLLLDQLRRDLVRKFPILPEVDHPRTLVSFKHPCGGTLWGPPEGIHYEYTFLGRYAKRFEATKFHCQGGYDGQKRRELYARFMYDFANLLSMPSRAPNSYSKTPAPMLGSNP